MELYEKIDNLILLENNLLHVQKELSDFQLSFFRIARESHQILYLSMVEALKGSANLSITGRPKEKIRSVKYQFGNDPFKEIHKVKVDGCKFAWRYSTPVTCEEPEIRNNKFEIPMNENYLISFYDLLAKIQTDCDMHKFVMSKPIPVSDEEMQLLEWLHEAVRNEREHFIPKFYSVFILDLIQSSQLSLSLSQSLLYESGNLIGINIPKNFKKMFSEIEHNLKIKEDHYIDLCKKYEKI